MSALGEAIARLSAQTAGDERLARSIREFAAETGSAVIYGDMGGYVLITPDNRLLECDPERDGVIRPLGDLKFHLIALVSISLKHPEFRALPPIRPPQAEDCAVCGGSGTVTAHRIPCGTCLGLGWVQG